MNEFDLFLQLKCGIIQLESLVLYHVPNENIIEIGLLKVCPLQCKVALCEQFTSHFFFLVQIEEDSNRFDVQNLILDAGLHFFVKCKIAALDIG